VNAASISASSQAAGLPVVRRASLEVEISSCWSKIGVEGDQSCVELQRHVHCHNCPVYSAAAVQFLDRPITADYRREWTDHFAREKRIATPAKTSAVIFRIGHEWLSMPTQAFQEIAERRALHSLPHRRSGVVQGIVNVRGELLICVALDRLLGLATDTRPKRSRVMFDRLLVATWNGQRITFPVDEVHGVHRFHQFDLREPPATVARSGLNCAIGVFPWRNFTVGFLDPDTLFTALNGKLA
jgi:chemotaxis-related protein WspD